MKKIVFFSLLMIIIFSSCRDIDNNSNTDEYRQYVIVRFKDFDKYVDSLDTYIPTITVNDGSFMNRRKDYAPELKDEDGNVLSFKSTVGVINYMVSLGWKFEGMGTTHLTEMDNKDASMLFSKPAKKDELDKVVRKSIIK